MIREHLEQVNQCYEAMGISNPLRIEAFVLRNADVDAKGVELPKRLERGVPKECFSNAAHLAIEKQLQYCEGYAAHERIGIPFMHAWCLDADGNVVDPTLEHPELYHYLGIKVPTKILIAELVRNEVYGLLDTGCGSNTVFMERFEKEVRK